MWPFRKRTGRVKVLIHEYKVTTRFIDKDSTVNDFDVPMRTIERVAQEAAHDNLPIVEVSTSAAAKTWLQNRRWFKKNRYTDGTKEYSCDVDRILVTVMPLRVIEFYWEKNWLGQLTKLVILPQQGT